MPAWRMFALRWQLNREPNMRHRKPATLAEARAEVEAVLTTARVPAIAGDRVREILSPFMNETWLIREERQAVRRVKMKSRSVRS